MHDVRLYDCTSHTKTIPNLIQQILDPPQSSQQIIQIMIDVKMDGLGNVLNEFERNANFELLCIDGVARSGVGDHFERDEGR